MTLKKIRAKLDKLAAQQEAELTEFFHHLSNADLVMLADDDTTHPRFDFVTGLCRDLAGRGLADTLRRYRSEPS